MKKIKVALVHDTIVEDGGAEKVLVSLSELFEEADIFTSFINKESKTYQLLKDRIKKSIILSEFFNKFISFFKPFLFPYWENLNFDNYDLVISSTHSFFSKSIITKPNTVHICYCHTPPKFLYGYETESRAFSRVPFSKLITSYMRDKDYLTSQRPDVFIANSKEVQRRIKNFYGKDSIVVHPPVKISKFKKVNSKNYFVIVSRLTKPKRIDLAIEACKRLNKNLIVIGSGPEEKRLKGLSNQYIKFMGKVSDVEKYKIVSEAKAFIFCAEHEDFGIAPVEALSLGVPVISIAQGGPLETIKEKKNGIFFQEHSVTSLTEAITKFEFTNFSREKIYTSAIPFSDVHFKKKIDGLVHQFLRK